ncbi:unnamed protein product [Closterium sp. NIES-53]
MPNYTVRRAFAAGVFACFVTFLLTDPLKRSPIAHLPFEPVQHDTPPRMWPPIIDLTEKLTYAQRRCASPRSILDSPFRAELIENFPIRTPEGCHGGIEYDIHSDLAPFLFSDDSCAVNSRHAVLTRQLNSPAIPLETRITFQLLLTCSHTARRSSGSTLTNPPGAAPFISAAPSYVTSITPFLLVSSPVRTPELCDPKPVELEEGKSPFVYGLNMTLVPNLAMEHVCGRPLGLRFHPVTGELFFADAYFGVFKVGRQGGLAQPVVTRVDGRPLLFANDLDIAASDENGTLYFTDTSTRFHRRNFFVAIMEGWSDGRLMKVDLATGEVEVLARNLAFANGVALSKDQSFLVVCETTKARCMRYWIKGPKAGTTDLFLDLPGLPDNRPSPFGVLSSPVFPSLPSHPPLSPTTPNPHAPDVLATRPWLRRILMRLPLEVKILYAMIVGAPHGYLIEVDENGEITEVLEDSLGIVVRAISEVEERNGQLWMGSVIMPHLHVLDYPVKVKLPGKLGQEGGEGEAEGGAVGEKEEEDAEGDADGDAGDGGRDEL